MGCVVVMQRVYVVYTGCGWYEEGVGSMRCWWYGEGVRDVSDILRVLLVCRKCEKPLGRV